MNILITGANGFVGTYFSNYLRDRGHCIRCAIRNESRAIEGFDNVTIENMSSSDAWRPALENIDAVIHLIAKTHSLSRNRIDEEADYTAVNVDITRALCEAIKTSSVQHLIFMSSVKVHGETSGNEPISEGSPLAPKDVYGRTKRLAEQMVESLLKYNKTQYTIVRPPLILGDETKGNLALLEKSIRKGYPLPFARMQNKRSLVTVQTLAAFVAACLHYPHLSQDAFLVADRPAQSTTAIIQTIGHKIGIKPRLFYMPKFILSILFNLIGRRDLVDKLLRNLELDASRSNELLRLFREGAGKIADSR